MAFENLSIEAPDFDRVRKEAGVHTSDALRLLWYTANDTRSQIRKIQSQLMWRDVPYLASNFTAGTGTWTVQAADQVLYKYVLMGDVMGVWVRLTNTTTTGGPIWLAVKIPRGLIAPVILSPLSTFVWATAAANDVGYVATDSTIPDHLVLSRDSAGTTWPNATDLNIGFTCFFQVQQV